MLSFRFRPKQTKPTSERHRAQLRVEGLEIRLNPGSLYAFYTEWATYVRNFQVRDIPSYVDVVEYAFLKPVNAQGDVDLFDRYAAVEKIFPGDTFSQPVAGNFNQLRLLKERNPGMRVNIAVGGWTLSRFFSDIAASPQARQHFGESLRALLTRWDPPDATGRPSHTFTGVDIDWEYPGGGGKFPGGRPDDGANFVLFLQELRRQMNIWGQQDGLYYELNAGVAAGDDKIQNLDIPGTSAVVDNLETFTFDFHGVWDRPLIANHNAPLHFSPNDPSDVAATYFIDSAYQQYLDGGADPSKLSMAFPLYSRCFAGVGPGPNNDGLYQPATGGCTGNPSQFEAGILDLKGIDSLVRQNPSSYQVHYDTVAGAAYVYNPNTRVFYTYENEQSVSGKLDFQQQAGGTNAWVWSIDGDKLGDRAVAKMLADRLHSAAPAGRGLRGHNVVAALFIKTPTFVTHSTATFESGPSLIRPAETPPVTEGQSIVVHPDPLTTSRIATSPARWQEFQAIDSVFGAWSAALI